MKAKNWKKLVKPDLKKKIESPSIFKSGGEEEKHSEEPNEEGNLQSIFDQNPTLNSLIKEREALERKMSELTGQQIGDGDSKSAFYFEPVPSITEKQAQERKREEKRKKELEILKKRRELGQTGSIGKNRQNSGPEARTNLTPLVSKDVITQRKTGNNQLEADENENSNPEDRKTGKKGPDFDQKRRKKKKERETFSSDSKRKKSNRFKQNSAEFDEKVRKKKTAEEDEPISGRKKKKFPDLSVDRFPDLDKKKKPDEFLIRDEKKREKLRKVSSGLKKFGSELQQKKKQLDQLNKLASDERFSDAFGDDFKNTLSTTSKITDKISRPFDEIRNNKIVNKFKDGWDEAKKKRINANRVKDKYRNASDRILKIDLGSGGDLQLKFDALKAKSLFEKKQKRKEEEKENEKNEARKKEREEERKREKEEEKKAEEKRERKREERREERRRRKKEKY